MSEEKTRRDGDTGLGTPDFEPIAARDLSAAEAQAYQKQDEEELKRIAADLLSEINQSEGWKLPKPIRQAVLICTTIVICIMGLLLVNQFIQFFTDVASLPVWAQWIAGIALALFGGVLIIIIISLLWKLIRFQTVPKINLKAIKALEERQEMQLIARQHRDRAEKLLEKYLWNFPATDKQLKKLKLLGLSAQDAKKLQQERQKLLDQNIPINTTVWLEQYNRCFQPIIDKLAQARVNSYARRIGLGTALSPIAIVDQIIVLYGCISMIKDLLVIYNLRPAFGQSTVIMARSITHIYLSGLIEGATENASNAIAENIASYVSVGATGMKIISGIGAKASEGTLNGVLIWRLGNKAIKMLQPVNL